MIEQEYILLIMNCKKYIKKAAFQKATWLKQIPPYLLYYHVIGNPELENPFTFDETNKILWVKVEDDYVSLPKKVIAAYNAIYDTFRFRYIFKTDDDQILVNPKFFDTICNLIKMKTPPVHYGGYIVNVDKPYISQYSKIHPELPQELKLMVTRYCSGRFYFLSKNAIVYLINKRNKVEQEYLEDYAIGYHLDQIYKINMMDIKTNNFFTDIEKSDFPDWCTKN